MIAGTEKRPDGTIRILQAGRAFAALAVVFCHTIFPTEHFVGPLPEALKPILYHGYLGVDFFFVLSGFIIFYTNHDNVHEPGWARNYLRSRLTRIYLPYLPIGIALALFYTLLPSTSQGGQPWSWIATLTLLPYEPHSSLGVAWTLTFELCFYLLAMLFFRAREPLAWATLWAMAITMRHVVGAPFRPAPDLSIESVLFNPINLEFVFGMYAAWIVIHGAVRSNLIFLVAANICFFAFAVDGFQRDQSHIFGLGIACLIIPLIRAEQSGRLKVGGLLLLLGNASYAIYLVHFPVLSLVARLSGRMGELASWPLNLAWSLAAVIAVGVGYHLLYERPALRLLKPKASHNGDGPTLPKPRRAKRVWDAIHTLNRQTEAGRG